MVGKVRCESASVSPCPGKCLAQAKTFSLCKPSVKAIAFTVTFSLLSPNDLFPMIGFFGFILISTTGAKLRQ